LAKHRTSSAGVWLVFHKAHTRVKSMPFEDFIREALCVGWIDSLIKRLDDDQYALNVTPRKPTSRWSDRNRKRWTELKAASVLMAAGLAARRICRRRSSRCWERRARDSTPQVLGDAGLQISDPTIARDSALSQEPEWSSSMAFRRYQAPEYRLRALPNNRRSRPRAKRTCARSPR